MSFQLLTIQINAKEVNMKLSMVTHTYNSTTEKAETERIAVQDQPRSRPHLNK
jgi:hypothetical protein